MRAAAIAVIALVVLALAGDARAQPACDAAAAAAEAQALRAQLRDAAVRARRWNIGWSVGYSAITAAQLGLAIAKWNPIGTFNAEFRDTLYVGAAKSAIGALSYAVTPLRVHVPDEVADPCTDVVALRAELAHVGKLERTLFWMFHAGNLALNIAGAAILAKETTWPNALVSFAVGYSIGLLTAYTMPRASWHAWRATATIAPVPLPGGAAVLIRATF